jgi:hypothetical protein
MSRYRRLGVPTQCGWNPMTNALIDRFLTMDRPLRGLSHNGSLLDFSRVVPRLKALITQGPAGPSAKKLPRELHQYLVATEYCTPLVMDGDQYTRTAQSSTSVPQSPQDHRRCRRVNEVGVPLSGRRI